MFLQGHPSSFAYELAGALEVKGCRVLRVNFCLGDAIYWLGRPAINYRGRFRNWAHFLRDLIKREGITDILYYGDRRPYHQVAAEVAREMGINSYVYEFGYLRPNWLTLERNGMSRWSHFPNDPEEILRIGAQFPAPDLSERYPSSIAVELTHEIFYTLTSYFFHLTYPFYNADRYYNPLVEYLTGIPKQLVAPRRAREAQEFVRQLTLTKRPYFLFPLQLQNDYQLRRNAFFKHQSDAIQLVINSFAANSNPTDHLVFKCHPLDNGGEGWPKLIGRAAKAAGVANRIHYIEGGHLATLLGNARGTVLINSTTGVQALISGCPVKVLGRALYDIRGLSHQDSLDSFWLSPTKPDPALVQALVRALAGTIQVKGSFFSKEGREAAVTTFVERLISGTVNSAGAYVDPPPRL